MLQRTLMIAALGVALVGGAATAVHAHDTAAPRTAAPHADLVLAGVGDQTAETDANVPCTGLGTAAEAGDCADGSDTAGPADSTDTAAEATTKEATGGSDTDTTESGP